MEQLRELYKSVFGVNPDRIEPLGAHASKRTIFRLHGARGSVIGVHNLNKPQNRAFIGFTTHFKSVGLPVAEIFGQHPSEESYLEEDLGTTTLLDLHLSSRGQVDEITPDALGLYQEAASWLPKFQVVAGKTFDYSLCHQSQVYDRRGMLWDMNFFLNSFVREYGVQFDQGKLEQDFEVLSNFLAQAGAEYFMYRDFQARNIMIRDGKPYFIDYQEGRRGPLQYDVVSLVYQSKANLPPEARKAILQTYLDSLAEIIPVDRERFLGFYQGFVFMRLMQVLGTYGEQGLKQKKEYFKQSIPFALKNLGHLLETIALPVDAPELWRVMREISNSQDNGAKPHPESDFSVALASFSYRAGMPPVGGEHGGGFVFDCRCIPNPGREDQYKDMTGLDHPVKAYLDAKTETDQFFKHITALVDQAIDSYRKRGFTSLAVSFGCTGGQHRSVYFTERLARELNQRTGLLVELKHHGLEALAKRRAEQGQ